MALSSLQPLFKSPSSLLPLSFSRSSPPSSYSLQNPQIYQCKLGENGRFSINKRRQFVCSVSILPVDPWAPSIDSQSIASQLFAFSLFPYIGFLYFITKSKSAPKLTLFGFYFLLAFVGATIPAGIYAKVQYGTSLSNVDWLHGGAESLLTLTNLFIVLGLRQALRNSTSDVENEKSNPVTAIQDEEKKKKKKSSV